MRHGKKFNHLSRTSSHRKSMLSNMAGSLIMHRRIKTTVPKAKELRKYVEPLITRAKVDSMHNRRTAFSYLKNKEVVTELFDAVGRKVGDRPGGYTRIIKMGKRLGDAAEMCYIELVDYNSLLLEAAEAGNKKRTRRGRRRKGGDEQTQAAIAADAPAVDETSAEASVEETTSEETTSGQNDSETSTDSNEATDDETKS